MNKYIRVPVGTYAGSVPASLYIMTSAGTTLARYDLVRTTRAYHWYLLSFVPA